MAELEPQVAVAGPGKLESAREFLLDTRAEMDKVSWPSREELTQATRVVLISAIVLGLVIGLVDLILQAVLIDGVAKLTQ
jgi:preprotein translocase subunit SecE